jgi:hypothetical protein
MSARDLGSSAAHLASAPVIRTAVSSPATGPTAARRARSARKIVAASPRDRRAVAWSRATARRERSAPASAGAALSGQPVKNRVGAAP